MKIVPVLSLVLTGCAEISGLSDFGAEAAGGARGVAGAGGQGMDGGGSGGAAGEGGAGRVAFTMIAPVFATSDDEDDPTLSGNGLEVFLNTSGIGGPDVFRSTRMARDEDWSSPVRVAELSSSATDSDFALSYDGLTLWLGSTRASTDLDIYVATRPSIGAAWLAPVAVAELNTSGDDLPCAVSSNGLTFVIERRNMPGGSWELIAFTRATNTDPWGGEQPIMELNATGSNRDAWLSADGLRVHWSRDGVIFEARRASPTDVFSAMTPVIELDNMGVEEADPSLTADETYILFSRGVSPNRDIYEASR